MWGGKAKKKNTVGQVVKKMLNLIELFWIQQSGDFIVKGVSSEISFIFFPICLPDIGQKSTLLKADNALLIRTLADQSQQ